MLKIFTPPGLVFTCWTVMAFNSGFTQFTHCTRHSWLFESRILKVCHCALVYYLLVLVVSLKTFVLRYTKMHYFELDFVVYFCKTWELSSLKPEKNKFRFFLIFFTISLQKCSKMLIFVLCKVSCECSKFIFAFWLFCRRCHFVFKFLLCFTVFRYLIFSWKQN